MSPLSTDCAANAVVTGAFPKPMVVANRRPIAADGLSSGPAMPDNDEFDQFIRRIRAGDALAAQELVRHYGPAIRREARLRLGPCVQPVYDSMDISQSVFGSFLLRIIAGQYEVESPRRLMGLLLGIARNKIREKVRNRREDSLESNAPSPLDIEGDPSKTILNQDFLFEFCSRLSDDERALWERRREHLSWHDISVELGAEPQTLRQRYSRAIRRVAHELGLEDSP
jgi:RNA polymerase sigma factor (sigma-70 family)